MIPSVEIETMKNAYSLMYIIENSLRSFIKRKMEKMYGLNWYRIAPKIEKVRSYTKDFNRLYLHELIPFLRIYPCFLDIDFEQLATELRVLIPIRNLIAHHQCLSEEELIILQSHYEYIIEVLANN